MLNLLLCQKQFGNTAKQESNHDLGGTANHYAITHRLIENHLYSCPFSSSLDPSLTEQCVEYYQKHYDRGTVFSGKIFLWLKITN